MINVSIRRPLISATVALAASLAMAGPAGAQYHQGSQAMYNTIYYSDAARTVEVGYGQDVCTSQGVYESLQGYRTSYVQMEPTAYCVDGQYRLEP
jgi:hypothetical protein